MECAEAFLKDRVSGAYRALIPGTLNTAYQAAKTIIDGEAVLNVPSAQHGRIIQWAVDLAFLRLCESGQWPFDFRWREYERPTGCYLEIRPSHSVITISQVSDPKQQPRDVLFRENKRVSSRRWLRGLPRPGGDEPVGGEIHIIMRANDEIAAADGTGLRRGT